MSENTLQINHPAVRLGAIALLASAALAAAGAPSARPSSASSAAPGSYGWPVKPFHEQHPVRGSFGDPRTVFAAPPTADGVLHGSGHFSFHEGIDISAPNGTPVYPVRDGRVTVASLEKARERVVVVCPDGVSFEYWHLTPRVRVGQWVVTDRTILGTILKPAGHVHLTEVDDGRPVNPLAAGHIAPYRDATVPRVEAIGFRLDTGNAAMVNFVRGRIALVAEAYDTPAVPVPGIWRGLPVAPALVTWRIESAAGKVVVAERAAADFRRTIPPDAAFWSVYARGTFQNMAVFGQHYSYLEPGCFLFGLTQTPFDTAQLRDGVYDLVVTAADIRGNSSSRSQRFTVHNRPGWIGS
jgi:murein DD-endopeptidase MepM/ murein hydrolase activator NlpD